MSKVNKGFLNFVNKNKYKQNNDDFDCDNVSETEGQEEIQEQPTQIQAVSSQKNFAATSSLKENEIIFQNVLKNDNNLNDGSLKSLLERFSGKVIEKEQPKFNLTKQGVNEEVEVSESESESEKNSDSEESDYEEERYNHFIKNRLDLIQNAEETKDEDYYEQDSKIQGLDDKVKDSKNFKKTFEMNNNIKNSNSKVESEIFVDNIPFNLHEKQIIKMLKNSNNSILRVKVLKDQNGRHRGKAYLKFSTKMNALNLIKTGLFLENAKLNLKLVEQDVNNNINDQNNNKFKHKNDSSVNRKNHQQEKREHNINFNNEKSQNNNEQYEKQQFNKNKSILFNRNNCTVFVRNLPSEIDENVLKRNLKKFGNIKSIRLMKNNNGKYKNFGYIDFVSVESVEKASKNTDPIIIGGKQLVLEKAKSTFDGGVYDDGKRLGKKKRRSLMNKETANNSK